MSANETEETDNDTESEEPQTTEYELKDGYSRVRRAGLVIEEDDTVELEPNEAEEHADVLREVGE